MKKCPQCSAELTETTKKCPACGLSVGDGLAETDVLPADPQANTPTRLENTSKRNSTSVTTGGGARFVSGTLLAGRYRIVGLIGKGGMGEVYKAEDLELDQTVALKFLPEELSKNDELLRRFRGEVRTARQVSHRNVCRVFDIGETEGLYYITMEYIDGDDLSMLLKRIGRLPSDKAVEISREICMGLAAIHKAGILHRDLKPANIIIDSKGEARITDFGIAGIEAEVQGVEARVGTPAYMSPEQIDGKELTQLSDIYSLGLLLYEIFTGKQAFEGESVKELQVRQATTNPRDPSEIVTGIDPLVENVIKRCLQKDPNQRPEAALKVAMSLPGGDPLQIALDAGQTPSPEMVAASPKKGALRPIVALALLAAVVINYGLLLAISKNSTMHRLVPLDKSTDVLRERSRELAEKFGYPSGDSIYRFTSDEGYGNYLKENDQTPERWQKLADGRPAVLRSWYRSSPEPIAPVSGGTPTFEDPPDTTSGMTRIILDTKGRLTFFNGVPPRVDDSSAAEGEFDWAGVLKEAGLDIAAFQTVDPLWTPQRAFDERRAFSGKYPEQSDIPIRVEAAAYRGKLVSFEIVEPWTKPDVQTSGPPPDAFWTPLILFILYFGILFVSAWLAAKNIRAGRSDLKGAFRIALFLFAARMLYWIFSTHHVAWLFGETYLLISGLQSGLFWASMAGFMYLAFEPYLRKSAPERVISWNRLLAGDWRDPLVGRDVLIGGAAISIVSIPAALLTHFIPIWQGTPPTLRFNDLLTQSLSGIEAFPELFLNNLTFSLIVAFMISFLIVFFGLLLRRKWLGALTVWLICVAFGLSAPGNDTLFEMASNVLFWTCLILLAARFGVLALMSSVAFVLLYNIASATDPSAWYAGNFILFTVFFLGLAIFGFYTSTAGQKLWQGKFFDEST